jgi:DNA topoisomerase I
MKLVIVESPSKKSTIEKILKKIDPQITYIVAGCLGHIKRITDEGDTFGIDVENNFQPTYEIVASKDKRKDRRKVIKELKKLAEHAEEVIIATDDDEEGETIGYQVSEVLGLDIRTNPRIIFGKIDEEHLQEALENVTTVRMPIVHAQQCRAVSDKLMGFEISPILQKQMEGRHLSAGRVKSVAVMLVLNRQIEQTEFVREPYYVTNAIFEPDQRANLDTKFTSDEISKQFLNHCITATFKLSEKNETTRKVTPPSPFKTSSLLKEAGRKFGMTSKMIMACAQKLYENGFISYHRTDSIVLSEATHTNIRDYVVNTFEENYYKKRNRKNGKNSQEAHEAIHPTDINRLEVSGKDITSRDCSVYELIWKRTVASQMADCEIEVQKWIIDISERDEKFICKFERELFDGYRRIYREVDVDDDGKVIATVDPSTEAPEVPEWEIDQEVKFQDIIITEKFTTPPASYDETGLISKLESLGIGRPSTYTQIIEGIKDEKRKYVVIQSKRGETIEYRDWILNYETLAIEEMSSTIDWMKESKKLFITPIGQQVTEYLQEHFNLIMDTDFTKQLHDDMDKIKEGDVVWHEIVRNLYDKFHPTVVELNKGLKDKPRGGDAKKFEKRCLGEADGKPFYAYKGKFGPVVQVGEFGVHTPLQYVNIPSELSLETVTMEDIMRLRQFPMDLGENVLLKRGPYGFYLEREVGGNKTRISLPKDHEKIDDLATFTLDDALTIITESETKESEGGGKTGAIIKTITGRSASIDIVNGKFGPFFKMKNLFVGIPKHKNIETLTQKDCKELYESKKKYQKSGGYKKKG